MDKCNRVGRTITADPYKKACRLNGRRKREKGGVKSASVCLCVETDAFLRLKINAANNFVDDADQTEVNDDTGYARVCGVCDRNGKFKPDGGRNRWIPQKIRDFGETVNDAIDTLRNLFRNKRDADDNDSEVDTDTASTSEEGEEEEGKQGYRRRWNWPRPPTINLPDVNIPVTVNLPDVNV